MRHAALVFALASCGTQPVGIDASADGATDGTTGADVASCPGDITACCANSCDNDVGMTGWVCVNGTRTCPAGTYSDVECKKKNPCMQIFCALPAAIPDCIACDGGAPTKATCDADAAVYACPSGSYSQYMPDGSSLCASDAGTD
jgi:hypothetical protein